MATTVTFSGEATQRALMDACAQTGIDATGALLIRALDNGIWRLPGGIVARIHQPGTETSALNEIRGAYWLYGNHIPVPLPRRPAPVTAAGRPVTFWSDLGAGGPANPAQAARILRDLHRLPTPTDFTLPSYNPFARFRAQIAAARTTPGAKAWLTEHAARLREQWLTLDWPTSTCVIHGDAGPGNTMYTTTGPHLIDLERLSIGHPEWDLATAAWHRDVFGADPDDYTAFHLVYGNDVTSWSGYRLISDVRSLCATLFALRHAPASTEARAEADHRLACLRGMAGSDPRPWTARKWIWTQAGSHEKESMLSLLM
ncbi:phosphotransferase family protein [Kitasatospora sp. NPDC059146]|uniref:phosphotransferase family protein n=1 Tax=Kitasatospora sp. NPDC059146 TaxID=3346741 RepID=UPI003676A404